MDKDRELKFVWEPGDIVFVDDDKVAEKLIDDLARRLEKAEPKKESKNSDTKE